MITLVKTMTKPIITDTDMRMATRIEGAVEVQGKPYYFHAVKKLNKKWFFRTELYLKESGHDYDGKTIQLRFNAYMQAFDKDMERYSIGVYKRTYCKRDNEISEMEYKIIDGVRGKRNINTERIKSKKTFYGYK